MRLVITIMSKRKITEKNKRKISTFFEENMGSTSEIFEYKEKEFFELDIDLLNVKFSKKNIYDEINKLIKLCEEIFINIQKDIDFIVANDDTSNEVNTYIRDWQDIKKFGLFVTTRKITNIKPYYSSKICNAYLNFKYVSFGCIF